jgi:hypothetical protein
VLLIAWPADAITDAELRPWLTSTTRLDVVSRGPDSSIPHRYVRVRGNVVVGFVFAILIIIQFVVIASGAQRGYYTTASERPVRGPRCVFWAYEHLP